MTVNQAVAQTAETLGVDARVARSALLALLWHQVFTVPLEQPLCGDTRIEEVREDRGVQFCA